LNGDFALFLLQSVDISQSIVKLSPFGNLSSQNRLGPRVQLTLEWVIQIYPCSGRFMQLVRDEVTMAETIELNVLIAA